MPTSRLWSSVTSSAARNGLWVTLNTLVHYGFFKLSRNNVYDFYFSPANRNISLRPHTSDFSCFRQIFMDGDYEMDFHNPDVVVDVGANIGLASIFFTERFHPSRIVALEPDPSNFEMLKRNTAGLPAVACLQKALWKSTGRLSLVAGNYDKWGVQVRDDGDTEGPMVASLDMPTLMREQNLSKIDLLKIDIEGAELDVFSADCSQWLPKVKVLVIELHDHLRKGCTEAFTNAISSIRHESMVCGENHVIINRDLL